MTYEPDRDHIFNSPSHKRLRAKAGALVGPAPCPVCASVPKVLGCSACDRNDSVAEHVTTGGPDQ